ncbi:MAG: pyruvate kinase [Candidatus Micrarchaeia archaeon]
MNMTKIIMTYGPSVQKPSTLVKVLAKADVVRVNFSHASNEEAVAALDNIRSVSSKLKKETAVLADLPGPKIRLGKIKNQKVSKNEVLEFYKCGKGEGLCIEFDGDWRSLPRGTTVSINDGYLKMKVIEASSDRLVCKVLDGGELSSGKGVNFHYSGMIAEAPTKEDIKKAEFASKAGFDMLAESFVTSSEDITKLRKHAFGLPIIAKIERKRAVANIAEIAREADAVMVARGDLALEAEIESIPALQARIVNETRRAGKPVIVATQVLISMLNSSMPTRAEVNDIANSVMQGVDAIMLSDETAVGKYPMQAVSVLHKTIANSEKMGMGVVKPNVSGVMDYIAYAAAEISRQHKLDCIFALTQSGATAKRVSAFRPKCKVIALSSTEKVCRQLAMLRGISAKVIQKYSDNVEMEKLVGAIAKEIKAQEYLIVYGSPHVSGTTDSLKYVGKENSAGSRPRT